MDPVNNITDISRTEKWCTMCSLLNNYNDVRLCDDCKSKLSITGCDIVNDCDDKNSKMISLGKGGKVVLITKKAFKRVKSGIINKKKRATVDRKIRDRKILLKQRLKEHKLTYRKHSVCDVFIKYGTPDIETVIRSLEKDVKDRSKNLMRLSKRLGRYKLEYNENVPSYKKYVDNGGDVKEAVRIGRVESIVMEKTRYLEYLKEYSGEDALDMAAIEYIDSEGSNDVVSEYLDSIVTINF